VGLRARSLARCLSRLTLVQCRGCFIDSAMLHWAAGAEGRGASWWGTLAWSRTSVSRASCGATAVPHLPPPEVRRREADVVS
jgi:hypothetical protein